MPHQCTTCGRTFPDGSKEMLSGCPNCGGNKFQFAPASSSSATSSGTDTDTESATGGQSGGITRASESASSSESDGDGRGITQSGSGSVSESASGSESGTGSGPRATSTSTSTSPSTSTSTSESTSTNRTWPQTASEPASSGQDDAPAEFTEWPESARRPDDRERAEKHTERPAPRADDSTVEAGDTHTEPEGSDGDEDAAQASARSDVVSSDELPASSATGPADEKAGPDVENGRVVSEPTDDERPSLEDLREELNEQFESIKILKPGQYELNLMELYDREEYIVSLQEDGRYVIDVPDSWRDGGDSDQ
ncbi:Zn-ribbon domain-containing protein [Natronosalvus rutilus]|uniref:Zn-ribbon domain-containing protein n=1 Tax=Natronosalvus rutilus TaxID=2953753 RepID=A0A9E7NA87_9EURY|nr:Zn-ribbon domain-containing protein [Natronosalvus rutilus]UTF54587.1 Zn-ribbon domain-containing protein [Natronosalvus rutilus]